MELAELNTWMSENQLRGYWTTPRQEGARGPQASYKPYIWRWKDVAHALDNAAELISSADSFRRFVGFVHPELDNGSPSHTITLGAQLVKPGERPAAHRHSLAALRFVVQGGGAATIVNGEAFPMEPGDLITTPSNSWHEHINESDKPIIWLDSLDGPLIRFLQVGSGEPCHTEFQDVVRPVGMSAIEGGPIRPAWAQDPGPQPAPYRYAWQDTRHILDMLAEEPGDPHDGIIVHYRNPRTGGWTLPSIACGMQMLRPGETLQDHRHTSTTIYHAFQGSGRTVIDGQVFEWEAGDSFVVPLWCTHHHENPSQASAYLFSLSDRPVTEAFGLYREEPA